MHKYYTDRKVLFCMCAGKDQKIKSVPVLKKE